MTSSIGIRNRYLLVWDAVLVSASVWLAFAVRFEGWIWGDAYLRAASLYVLLSVPIKLFIFFQLGLYRRIWRLAGFLEVEQILLAGISASAACALLGGLILPTIGLIPIRIPYSVLILDAFFTLLITALPRFLLRLQGRLGTRASGETSRRVLIAGAGAAGGMIARELRGHPNLGLEPVGFVDDDASKHRHKLQNLPVLGGLIDIPRLAKAHKVDEIVIAMPSASGRVVRAIVQAAGEAHIRARTMPSLHDLISGRLQVSALRQVEIEDLLRRDVVQTDLERVRGLAMGETVLITGAGGSIGSELCRQIARLDPARLVLVGHGENSIFAIHQEMTERFPSLPISTAIVDIRDRDRLARIFERFDPFTVFHAAAHKHVPLMEANVPEAITNNVLGTRNVVELAAAGRVEHLVLISTDKAVRPTNVMGATKRVAEQVVQAVAEGSRKNFVSVRFGNVLGSRGSVVPTFMRQIAAGGPVTVTHPEMRRYFMTIPESVQLVLQAGALGQGGEVFVLNMGEPIKVADLAADLIRLSGHDTADIEIRFTGTRPGEKLYEEMFFSAENATPTEHPKVLKARNASLAAGVPDRVDRLIAAAEEGWSDDDLKKLLQELVPDFDPSLAGMPSRHSGDREIEGRGEGGK